MVKEHVAEHGLQNLRERVEGRFLKAKKAAGEIGDEIERRRVRRGTGRGGARVTVTARQREEGNGIGPTYPQMDEAALLLAAALFDVKHQLESRRTRPFQYRPKGRTDRIDIASELQGELNLWIADWLEWDSLLDNVERVDPSLIAVRPHVPAHAEWSGACRSLDGPRARAIDGRTHAAALIEDEEEGPTPEPVELQERPFPPAAEHFHCASATQSSGSRT